MYRIWLNGVVPFAVVLAGAAIAALSDPLPPDLTYRPLPVRPFSAVRADDVFGFCPGICPGSSGFGITAYLSLAGGDVGSPGSL